MRTHFRKILLFSCVSACFTVVTNSTSGAEIKDLPVYKGLPVPTEDSADPPQKVDYLLSGQGYSAVVSRDRDGRSIVLENGLIRRRWRVTPNGACVAFDNLMTGVSMLRSVRPEARVTINGDSYEVGGLTGQPNHAYLTSDWLDVMKRSPAAMRWSGFEVSQPSARFAWKKVRHHAANASWPPKGVHLRMDYVMPSASEKQPKKVGRALRVSVHYELYDGVPVMCKWVTVHNNSKMVVTVDRITTEELALVEHSNWVETREGVDVPRLDYLHVETDFAFGGFNHENANRHVVHWRGDPLYKTQTNYLNRTPCLLVVEPTYGPAQDIKPGGMFESYRTFELVYDGTDRERQGLALRRMYRTIAPWVTENPLFHHLLSSNPKQVRKAIDQAKEVGFESVILSFGSGFDMENTDPEYLRTWKDVADYAKQQGVEIGAYSLFSSRSIGKGNNIVCPPGQSPTHRVCPAATSPWGLEYFRKIQSFHDYTGFDLFENDGPYPGDVDITQRLPYQKGEQDSRWAQWKIVTGLYKHLRANGVYINAPDYYFLSGSNKCGMGYRERNWSLPRAEQLIHTRQNIYDGTWKKTPSMGWMFVPLSQYHGGGAAATIEPLDEHLDHYGRMIASNLALGVQACYRGPRLFDTERTKKMVKKWVVWFKKYRDILESDLLHGRRADGQDLDWMLHVNPQLKHKGMLVVFNPLRHAVSKQLDVNLYYTGLQTKAQVRGEGQTLATEYTLSRDYHILLPVTVPAESMSWYVIE